MNLIGYRTGYGYYIDAVLICANPRIDHPVKFKIDSGCDITTISLNDALSMKLNFANLIKISDTLGVGGHDSYL